MRGGGRIIKRFRQCGVHARLLRGRGFCEMGKEGNREQVRNRGKDFPLLKAARQKSATAKKKDPQKTPPNPNRLKQKK